MLAISDTPCYTKNVTSVGCFYFLNKLPLFWTPCACDKVDRKQDGGILLGEEMNDEAYLMICTMRRRGMKFREIGEILNVDIVTVQKVFRLGIEGAKRENATSVRKWDQKRRKDVLEKMGGKCVRCGFSDFRALQIDHINGGGTKERKKGLYWIHKKIMAMSEDEISKEYQLLCANCNWIKKFENGETNRKR